MMWVLFWGCVLFIILRVIFRQWQGKIFPKHRSIGVSVFGYLFIIWGAFGAISTTPAAKYPEVFYWQYSSLPKYIIFTFGLLGAIHSIADIIAGINVLDLRKWARKLVIILVLCTFTQMLATKLFNKKHQDIIDANRRKRIEQHYDKMTERKEMEFSKEEYIEKWMNSPYYPAVALHIVIILFNLSIIFFFTRPEVKRQFQ